MNPYRHLQTKIRALLATEAKMSEQERRANSWMIQVNCADTKLLVGKGDVNTMFYQFGDDKRKVNYADWLLEHLEVLAAQPYTRYLLTLPGGETRNYWSLESIRKRVEPELGMRVVGIRGIMPVLEKELVLIVNNGSDALGFQWCTAKGTKQAIRFAKNEAAHSANVQEDAEA